MGGTNLNGGLGITGSPAGDSPDSATVALLLPLPASLHEHAWLLDHQYYAHLLETLVGGSEMEMLKRRVPGQIPVGRRSWGVTNKDFWQLAVLCKRKKNLFLAKQ